MDELNEILIKATHDPMYRPEFYKKLLESNIYFLTNDVAEPGYYEVTKNTPISTLMMTTSNGEIICPIFTSVERILEAYPNSAYHYVGMNAKVFFSSFSGAPFILNPGCKASKELLINEVKALLDGSLFNNLNKIVELSAGSLINVCKPAKLPLELIEILKNCFSQYSEISEAYYTEGFMGNEEIHPIIAVRGNGDLNKVFSIADMMIAGKIPQNQAVDFINLDDITVLEAHFKDIQPFYKAHHSCH